MNVTPNTLTTLDEHETLHVVHSTVAPFLFVIVLHMRTQGVSLIIVNVDKWDSA